MIRILIVDDQNLVREGIKILLEKSADIEIIGDASDGEVGLQKIESLQPDIVLLDIEMPGISGLDLARKIERKFPAVKVIMLSTHEDAEYVAKATAAGAKGYMLKNASTQELEWSIKLVDQGYSAIKSELLEARLGLPPVNSNSSSNGAVSHNSSANGVSNPQSLSVRSAQKSEFDTSRLQNIPVRTISQKDKNNLDKLENLLANNQAGRWEHSYQKPKSKRQLRSVRNLKLRRTVGSFEFKLLTFVILFSLAFLTFIALS